MVNCAQRERGRVGVQDEQGAIPCAPPLVFSHRGCESYNGKRVCFNWKAAYGAAMLHNLGAMAYRCEFDMPESDAHVSLTTTMMETFQLELVHQHELGIWHSIQVR